MSHDVSKAREQMIHFGVEATEKGRQYKLEKTDGKRWCQIATFPRKIDAVNKFGS